MYTEGYLAKLNRERIEQQEKPCTLENQIKEWWDSLPEVQRYPHYHISYFTEKFKEPSQVIGPVLYRLGFKRVRKWGQGPFVRLWIPPERTG